jgi:hypothetical protein
MVMIIETAESRVDVAADARSILLVHAPDADGLCRGCCEFASAFARSPAQWAYAVLDGGDRS